MVRNKEARRKLPCKTTVIEIKSLKYACNSHSLYFSERCLVLSFVLEHQVGLEVALPITAC